MTVEKKKRIAGVDKAWKGCVSLPPAVYRFLRARGGTLSGAVASVIIGSDEYSVFSSAKKKRGRK